MCSQTAVKWLSKPKYKQLLHLRMKNLCLIVTDFFCKFYKIFLMAWEEKTDLKIGQ